MGKNCIYCKVGIDDDSVVDVCQRCGISVWGPKMFAAIVENMQGAREAGDLYQGSVTETPSSSSGESVKPKSGLSSIAQEALAIQESQPMERQVDSLPPEPTDSDVPPLVDSFSKPESFGPESETKLDPPHGLEPPPQHVSPQVQTQVEEKDETASMLIDNLNKSL
jgi:hypothetical protein